MARVRVLAALLAALLLAQQGGAQATAAGAGRTGAARAGAQVFPGYAALALPDPPRLPSALGRPLLTARRFEPGYFVVHFAHPIGAPDRAWLDGLTGPVRRADGSPLARWYVPDDALVAWVGDLATWRALAVDARVDWLGRYQPAYKLEPELAAEIGRGPLRLDVELVPGHPAEGVSAELGGLGARVLEHVELRGRRGFDASFLIVEAEAGSLTRLAFVEGIRRIARHGADAPPAEGFLPLALDGLGLQELAAHARDGLWLAGALPERELGNGPDAVAALLDLMSFEHPELLASVAADEAACPAPPKNLLVLPATPGWDASAVRAAEQEVARALARLAGRASASRPSAALLRALLTAGEEARVVRDVPAEAGFASPYDAAQVVALSCFDSSEPLDVTLVWTDEPGGAGTGKLLIDDLDLVVRAPDGTLYRGNNIDGVSGESLPGGAGDTLSNVERVRLARPAYGDWSVTVQPVRGDFAAGQGYALVVTGGVEEPSGSREHLGLPITAVLRVTQGLSSRDGSLVARDIAQLQLGDDDRYAARDRASLALAFEQTVPATAVLSAIRVCIEHDEEPRVVAGNILWKLGQGALAAPAIVASTTAPIRPGPQAEALDVWAPASLVSNANALVVVIQNDGQNDATLLDRVFVEVDYTLPDAAPHVISTPNPTVVLGQGYAYDADGRAEASGTAVLTWSLVSGPAGFSIQPATGIVSWAPASTGSFPVTIRVANALGSESQSFVVSVLSAPPLPPIILPANATSIVYLPPERQALGPAAAQERLNVYLPPGAAPPGGWPVVLNNRAGGGLPALPLASLQSTGATAPLHALVAAGVAVVDFGVTGIGDGLGLLYPPGHPSGRYESFRPADDNPEKEAEWAVQWLKTQSAFPLATSRICLRGSSHGAIISIWAAMGPERARASGSAQVRASTRVKAILALQPPTSVWAFDQSPFLASRLTQHYEQQAFPGVPATAFGQVAETLQKGTSVMGFAFQSAEARLNAEAQAICLVYGEPVKRVGGVPADMSLDALGFPRLHDTLGQPFIHDTWAGYVLFRRLLDLSPAAAAFHRLNSVFAVRDTSALPPPFDFHTRTFPGGLTGAQATALAHDWVLRTLGVR